jgi:hypothetical protein
VGIQTVDARRITGAEEAHVSSGSVAGSVSRDPVARARGSVAESPRSATGETSVADDEGRDLARVRDQLRHSEGGTYIGEVIAAHDSALTRWPSRVGNPLRVWVQHAPNIDGWQSEFGAQVNTAFESWMAVGLPVRFEFVRDSARADVHVTWVDRFKEPISGKTLWGRDDRFWIVNADIILAVRHQNGDPLDAPQMRAIALHEVGHLLGLDHTADTGNIMAPRVRVRELSAADLATARLLYALPPGSLR